MRTITPAGRLYSFSRLDATAVVLYVSLSVLLAPIAAVFSQVLLQLFADAASAAFAINLVFYLVVGTFAVLAAWRVVDRDLRILATRPWFTLLMVPVSLLAMVVFAAILVAATGASETSVNQAAVRGLVRQIPAWLVIPLLVIVAPFVEEYIFRHLLIGKLSRRLNIWLCCALSVLLFAAIHVVGREGLVLDVLMPYLAMGAVLVAVYVWTGKNVMFSYFVHAAKNLLAVILMYAIPPELLDQVTI
ncbi:CPBP family intramembrane glutamic endopeptidase [Arthrobacter sp. ISL-30]|uniref:CPBP family intramembrane glutamic endopeptidase n=1 Tax=Arthrobacter sp. ISL-30 TaxID=2819109 RepID=UPI001BEC06CC|nr:CPBP family intramembrane glutamic endopeptidase [Arthrobacter sp. ISL-30]MBT2515722.1 CPBP family intramembrane metalloprotease [Arthrobacter sp. ISL-30]